MKNPCLTAVSLRDVFQPRVSSAILAATLLGLSSYAAHAQVTGFNQTASGTYDYNLSTNWVDGDINGVWGPDLTLAGSQTLNFGVDTTLATGLTWNYAGAANMTFSGTGGTHTITLDGDVIANTQSSNRTFTFGNTLNMDLDGGTRLFNGSSGTLTMNGVISNGSLVKDGNWFVELFGANTYSGTTTVNTGSFRLSGNSGSAALSDITVKTGGGTSATLAFGRSSTGTGVTRAKSVTLDGLGSSGSNTANLFLYGSSGNNSIETISGALTVANGYSIVTLSPLSSRNVRLTADSLVLSNNGVVFFRGTDLGVNTVDSVTGTSSNIVFNTAPTLTGTGTAGTSTIGIIKGAYGDTSTSGNGSGLVTYDSTYGVRLLNTSTEYKDAITDGQTQLDNIRIVGDGTGKTVTLNSTTTVNSLSLLQGPPTGGGDGMTIDGAGTLKISSGVIFSSYSSSTSGTADSMIINAAKLDFDNKDALIMATGSTQSSGGNLTIKSEITNASSLVKSGPGVLKIFGATSNTYTGDTIMNGGTLELGKTAGLNAIGGNLIVNAGDVFLVAANQIGDSSNITVNGGKMNFLANAVNSRDETFGNLAVTGGSVIAGKADSINTVTMNNATLTGGTVTVNRNNKVVVSNALAISNGATLTVDRYATTNATSRSSVSVGTGGLAITQAAEGAYTPIILTGGNASGVKGGELVLNGDVSFTGTGSNANTTTIAAVAATGGGGEGSVLLEGTRTFNIGDGSAARDLTIEAVLANGVATGGLTKTGAGTLALAGSNTYSGPTTISAGNLQLTNASGSATGTGTVTVSGGNSATLSGVGTTTGLTTVTGGSRLAAGLNTTGANSNFGTVGTLHLGTTGGLTLTNANLDFDLASTAAGGSDLITTSALTLGSAINFTFNGLSGSVLETGSAYSLVIADSVANPWNIDGITTTFLGNLDGNYTAAYSIDGATLQVTFAAVPEPGTYAMLLGGLGALIGFQRSRRVRR